jgi:hypothetical protein
MASEIEQKMTPALASSFLEGGDDGHRIEHRVDCDAARFVDVVAGFLEFRIVGLLHAGEDFLLAERDAELLVDLQHLGIDVV